MDAVWVGNTGKFISLCEMCTAVKPARSPPGPERGVSGETERK